MRLLRQATPADLEGWYGAPPKFSMRAWVLELDGRAAGVCGLYFSGGRWLAFSELKPWARRHRRSILRAAGEFARVLNEFGRPVLAIAQAGEPGAARLLEWCGFEFDHKSPQGDIYRWRV